MLQFPKILFFALAVGLISNTNSFGQSEKSEELDLKQFEALLVKGTWYRTLGENSDQWQREHLAYTFRKDHTLGYKRFNDTQGIQPDRIATWTIKKTKQLGQFAFYVEHPKHKTVGKIMHLESGTMMRYDPKTKRIYISGKSYVAKLHLRNASGSVFDRKWHPPKKDD